MKKLTLTFIILIAYLQLFAQRAEADTIITNNGDLIIQPILHGSLVLSWNNQAIYVDPYGGSKRFEGLPNPTLLLITDIHGDHLNSKTLGELKTIGTTSIVPQAVMEKLPGKLKKRAAAIENGQTVVIEDIEILAIPMYNLPESKNSRHPKGRGNGYLLTIGGKRIYISGDTEDTPEMRNLQNIDIAFVCMNLPFTMNVDQAASAVNEFKPKIVYPYHYRGKDGLSDVESFKMQVLAANPDIDVRLREWYLE
ncbi:MAG: MBL fold metallo-hydrolase [Bacteroidota bacterium]